MAERVRATRSKGGGKSRTEKVRPTEGGKSRELQSGRRGEAERAEDGGEGGG